MRLPSRWSRWFTCAFVFTAVLTLTGCQSDPPTAAECADLIVANSDDLDAIEEELVEMATRVPIDDRQAFVGECMAEALPGLFAGAVAEASGSRPEPGTLLVGSEIEPGVYRVTADPAQPFSMAYCARLGEGLGVFDIIANDIDENDVLCRVEATDYAFEYTGILERIE